MGKEWEERFDLIKKANELLEKQYNSNDPYKYFDEIRIILRKIKDHYDIKYMDENFPAYSDPKFVEYAEVLLIYKKLTNYFEDLKLLNIKIKNVPDRSEHNKKKTYTGKLSIQAEEWIKEQIKNGRRKELKGMKNTEMAKEMLEDGVGKSKNPGSLKNILSEIRVKKKVS